jgi:adenylate cyclase
MSQRLRGLVLVVASGTEKQLESHRREITALFCDLRTGFSESSDPEDVMALLHDYHGFMNRVVAAFPSHDTVAVAAL